MSWQYCFPGPVSLGLASLLCLFRKHKRLFCCPQLRHAMIFVLFVMLLLFVLLVYEYDHVFSVAVGVSIVTKIIYHSMITSTYYSRHVIIYHIIIHDHILNVVQCIFLDALLLLCPMF